MTRLLLFWLFLSTGFALTGFSQEPIAIPETALPDTLPPNIITTQEVTVITLSDAELEADEGSHDISSLLQGSRDVFVSTAGFTFSAARFRPRGMDSENTIITINGVPVNDPETGRPFFSVWGGLNDVTRLREGHNFIGFSPKNFGGLGGTVNIVTRASRFGENVRTTYSNSNTTYSHRAMFTYSTGLRPDGWAFVLSGSRRVAQEGYVQGTFYDAYSYFLSVERVLNPRHSLGLIAFGAPMKSGRPGVASQEAYDLTGNNFYNPNWGFQQGEVRNSRVNHFHTPMAILSHYWDPNPELEIATSAAFVFGRGGTTALNWYDSHASFHAPGFTLAGDPRPDHHRRMPANNRTDPATQALLTQLWQNDPRFSQINWDWLYNANFTNLFTVQQANGTNENITGLRSKYIVEERRSDRQQLVFTSNLTYRPNPRNTISGGLHASLGQTRQFKTVNDLLGGEFWLDIDQFAERDFEDPTVSQNDIRIPNRVVREGERFGYDFTGHINQFDGFVQSSWILPRWDFYVGGMLSHTRFWRTGHMQNGRFPEKSLGEGNQHDFTNFGLKGGVTWKITGRQYLTANTKFTTRAPYFRDAYISSRIRDEIIEGLGNETIISGDLNYFIRTADFKSRLTVYYTEFQDQTWSRSYFHDDFRSFVNYIMTGVNTRHAGLELGIEVNFSPTLSGQFAAGTGSHIYNSRPKVTVARDNDRQVLATDREVFIRDFRIGGMSHTAASAGLRYNHPRFWFVGISANYFADMYIDINPDRRTAEALTNLVTSDPQWSQMVDQEKFDNFITIDMFLGYSFQLRQQHRINLNLSIDNLLGSTNNRIGGFEQLRYDSAQPDRFPSRYFYMFGRTYFLNIAFTL